MLICTELPHLRAKVHQECTISVSPLSDLRVSRIHKEQRFNKVEKSQRLLPEISNLVRTESSEVLFKEGAEQYWIMVQKPLLKPLLEEAKISTND